MSGKVGFVSLGCPKALVDSERILTQLRAEGYAIVPSYDEADVVVVNTCGFITPAVEESLDAIGEALESTGKVVVTGCLGERPDEILERHPKVLAITGHEDVDGVMEAVHKELPPNLDPHTQLVPVPPQGIKLTPKHYAYLKIAEGCNHKCSFCIIPNMRGLQVSRDASDILYEAYRLIASGTKEILVIAQDSSAYGVDIRHRETDFQDKQIEAHLVPLVTELAEMGAWVRLHYVYPYPHVRKLIPLMAEGKLLPYLDVPLQHASPKILRAMRRPGSAEKQLETIKEWRAICPELTLRSTFIVGFPGETEEDFQQLLDFLTEAQIDRLGAFTYSEVDGAVANDLPDKVAEEVKQERYNRLMEHQQAISTARLAQKVGTEIEVIIDDYGDFPGDLVGRSKGDAPGIDGTVFVTSDGTTKIGDIVNVKVTKSDAYDLYGEQTGAIVWKPNVMTFG